MKGCRPLTNKEVQEVLNNTKDQRERLLILVALYFGVRISEALQLKFGDFKNNDYIKILRNKKSNTTVLKIPDFLHKELQSLRQYYSSQGTYVGPETPLFVGRKGPMSRRCATRLVQNIKDRAGLKGKVALHSFRKTFITTIYKKTNFDVVQTCQYSGHRNLGNLICYIKTTEKNDLTDDLNFGIA